MQLELTVPCGVPCGCIWKISLRIIRVSSASATWKVQAFVTDSSVNPFTNETLDVTWSPLWTHRVPG